MIERLLHLIGFGRVKLVADDKELMGLQVSQGNTGSDSGESITDDVPFIGQFGLSSNPPIDAEILLLRRGGDRSQTLAIGSSHRPSRPKALKPGDTKIYDVRGAFLYLSEDGIVIDAAGLDVRIVNAATVTIVASAKIRCEAPLLEVTGDVVSRADGTQVSLNGLRDAYAQHKHTGVQTGGGTSGLTNQPV